MKHLGYVWTAFVNIIALFVVIAIFDTAYEQFEKLVFVLLVMIYIAVVQFSATWGKGTAEVAFATANEFQKIMEALGKDVSLDREILKEATDGMKPKMVTYWINAAFNSIIGIIALYNLFTAL